LDSRCEQIHTAPLKFRKEKINMFFEPGGLFSKNPDWPPMWFIVVGVIVIIIIARCGRGDEEE